MTLGNVANFGNVIKVIRWNNSQFQHILKHNRKITETLEKMQGTREDNSWEKGEQKKTKQIVNNHSYIKSELNIRTVL